MELSTAAPDVADAVSAETVRAWVARAQTGDAESFGPIVAAHRDKLFRFTLNITRNRHDAEDICQRTFINAWRHLARFDNTRPFSNWLFGIAYKDAVKLVTRRKPVTGEMPEVVCERSTPDAVAASAETPMWDLARAELSPERHAMMWMHYGEDIPVAEIARITGRTVVSVKVHLFRSRGILRERLDKAEKAGVLNTNLSLSSLL
jgi:RNA polymerase sigma factor (sigma-70 family)